MSADQEIVGKTKATQVTNCPFDIWFLLIVLNYIYVHCNNQELNKYWRKVEWHLYFCLLLPTEKVFVHWPRGIRPNVHLGTFPGAPLAIPQTVTLTKAQSLHAPCRLRMSGWCRVPALLAGLNFLLSFEFHGSVSYRTPSQGMQPYTRMFLSLWASLCLTNHMFRSCLG